MKKKKVVMVVIIVLIVVAGLLLVAYFSGWFHRASGQQKRFMNEINEANTIVMYYGNLDPGKEVTINYRKVTEFTDETIGDSNNQYVYHEIVIFDFDGEMNISNEELLLIKDYCENKNYDLLYYGTAHLEQFSDCGFFTQLDSEDCGFTYNGSYWMNRVREEEWLNSYLLTGNWLLSDNERYDTENEHDIWKFVIDYIEVLIMDSMGELQ